MFVFCIFFVLLSFSGVVTATDLDIITFQDITDNCFYDSVTSTYKCLVDSNGDVWDNINIINSISLPYNGLQGGRIIFQANNDFVVAGSISANGQSSCAGSGGLINITAKTISVGDLSAVGGTYYGSGGEIVLIAESINAGSINIYGAKGPYNGWAGCYANGGSLKIIANETHLQNINAYSQSAKYSGSGGTIFIDVLNFTVKKIDAYGGRGDGNTYDGGGSGGTLNINSRSIIIESMDLHGGFGASNAGSGGSVRIETINLTITGIIDLHGGKSTNMGPGSSGGSLIVTAKEIMQFPSIIPIYGGNGRADYNAGAGGTVKIITDNDFVVPTINAYGGTGVSTTNYPSLYGGAGGLVLIVAKNLMLNNVINANAGGGAKGTGVAKSIILYFDDIIYGGTGIYSSGSGNGGDIYLFTDKNINLDDYLLSASRYKATSKRTVPTGFRMISTIKKFSTNNLFTGSTQIRVIDPESGIHVPITKTYNAWFGETDIDDGQVNSLFGDKPLMIMLAKKYYLEVTTSDDLFFSKVNCDLGIANCDTHFVEFRQYYE